MELSEKYQPSCSARAADGALRGALVGLAPPTIKNSGWDSDLAVVPSSYCQLHGNIVIRIISRIIVILIMVSSHAKRRQKHCETPK